MKALLRRMLDENEFLSRLRRARAVAESTRSSLPSSTTAAASYVRYQPAESDTGLFGGNSNWRGPIWMPVNYLLIESLQQFHHYYGDDFKVECPTGSGACSRSARSPRSSAARLIRLFLRDEQGRRAVFGDQPKLQDDPHFRDHILFYEYFHGDTGRGVGAVAPDRVDRPGRQADPAAATRSR